MQIASSVFTLVKYKLSLAVTLSAVAGYYLYKGETQPNILLLIGGVFFLAGGSAALNQVQEYKRDALMSRTYRRPIPSGKLKPAQALVISVSFCLAGFLLLLILGLLPALLGLVTLALYNGLYTWLKPLSSFAVIPGGLVGAIPPMIGWTAAGGTVMQPVIIFVATLMFLWQMPHFWLLIIRYGKEYEAAGFSTLKRKLDDNQIKRLVFWWMTISLLFLLTASLFGINLQPWLFITVAILNVVLIGFFYLILFRTTSKRMLRLVFILTNVFLTIMLLALILNSVI
ncbi:MAG: protoheme IX farnesyltransferase [Bacteroidales bacterium]|jgi:protoheme IX farnesyltransferase